MKKLTFLTAILLATTTFAQIPNYVPTNGLIGWWPFNGNANDESGNGLNGILINQQNGLAFSNDRYNNTNQSLIFNSISNQSNAPYIDIINSINSINNNYSINFWVKVSSNLITGEIINKGSDENSFFSRIQGTNSIAFGNLPTYINTSILIDTIEWKMYSFTFNSNGIGKLYIDGNLFYSQQISNPPLNNNNLSFGKMPSGGSNGSYYPYQGKLDDIGIWNRALTDCEIKDLYNSQLGSANTTSSQNQTALDAYTWPVNNQTYTQSGMYSDTLVNAAGCDSIVTLNLTLSYTGINELSTSTITISPNPTSDYFTISGLELFNTISSMTIKDVNGKTIKELDPKAAKFSLGAVKSGVYFLTITAGNKQEVVKIIKE
jgi:hypothetical protein